MKYNQKRRVYGIFCIIIMLLTVASYRIFSYATSDTLVQAASTQSKYKLNISNSRGYIYDYKMEPLVNSEKKIVAAVLPTIENISLLNKLLGESRKDEIALALENNVPFLIELDSKIQAEGIDVFEAVQRYSDNQLASNLIGYLDSEGEGISGIELAMEDFLGANSGEISVTYNVDALGRVITGADRKVTNTVEENNSGVVLTLDKKIQELAENASKRLESGAIVVTEIPNCEVRAMVSAPTFSQNNLAEAVESEGSPFVNRALSAYAPGSVFKLVTAAVEIENDIDTYIYNCTGSVEVSGRPFSCINNTAHGIVTRYSALQKSCNCYFINAATVLGGQPVLTMAYNMGFGVKTEYGNGLISAAGNLTEVSELSNQRALANFSIGQGDVLVTPMQVAGMINSIASGGEYTQPKIIYGTVDNNLEFSQSSEFESGSVRIMQESTASELLRDMKGVVKYGTGNTGNPDNCIAGVKTGTAQTGAYDGEKELNNYWYCGFIEDEKGPRYCITILEDGQTTGGTNSALAFKQIAEGISDLYF